jgi:hypothetical protein
VALTDLAGLIERMHLAAAVNHALGRCSACDRSTPVLSLASLTFSSR